VTRPRCLEYHRSLDATARLDLLAPRSRIAQRSSSTTLRVSGMRRYT